MSALYLTEEDVRELLEMRTAIAVVEQAFRELAAGTAVNVPRQRVKLPGIWLHQLAAGLPSRNVVGSKNYTTTAHGARFLLWLWSTETGEPLCVLEADALGQIRTGAVSAVATNRLARPEAKRVGILGCGTQAVTQLEAVCAVRPIATVKVFSRNMDLRQEFAQAMSRQLGLPVEPAESAAQCVTGQDVIITATTSRSAVFPGAALSEGTHLNAVGSNQLGKSELDINTLRCCGVVVCDQREQCRLEAGELQVAVEAGLLTWEQIGELGSLLQGEIPGRTTAGEITLFKSVGLAIADVAVGIEIYNRALAAGRGIRLPL